VEFAIWIVPRPLKLVFSNRSAFKDNDLHSNAVGSKNNVAGNEKFFVPENSELTEDRGFFLWDL